MIVFESADERHLWMRCVLEGRRAAADAVCPYDADSMEEEGWRTGHEMAQFAARTNAGETPGTHDQ